MFEGISGGLDTLGEIIAHLLIYDLAAKPNSNARTFLTKFFIYIYVWIYENEAKGLKSLTKRASFFSPKGTI